MSGWMGSSRVQACIMFCWCDLVDGRTWGGRRGSNELHPVFCENTASDILWFEAAHEMGLFKSPVEKQLSGTFNERLFQKEHLTEIFPWGRAISHPYGRGEKGTSWGFFQKAVQHFFNIWAGESENFGINLCGIFGFHCILIACNILDIKFNPDIPSSIPQITKCSGQLIRTVYVLSRWWICHKWWQHCFL